MWGCQPKLPDTLVGELTGRLFFRPLAHACIPAEIGPAPTSEAHDAASRVHHAAHPSRVAWAAMEKYNGDDA